MLAKTSDVTGSHLTELSALLIRITIVISLCISVSVARPAFKRHYQAIIYLSVLLISFSNQQVREKIYFYQLSIEL